MEGNKSGGFAEIDIGPRPSSSAVRLPFKLVPASQLVPPRRKEPVREKIYEMRRLASSNPFGRQDAKLFFEQAKFMEDHEDDYDGAAAGFFMYYPDYQHMGYEQLRTYFSWRTKTRRGEIQPVPLSYVFVYIYELLNGVGVESPSDGLNKLMELWRARREESPELDRYVPRWLKDYHIYYDLPRGFEDFARENGLLRHFPELFMFSADAESCLALWNAASTYDISKSRFYESSADIIRECFFVVIKAVGPLCESMFYRRAFEGASWFPFSRAVFYPRHKQRDRTVHVGRETYYCKNDNWTYNAAVRHVYSRELAGNVIKKTEACLRSATGYRFKLTTNPTADLDAAIEKAVAEHLREKNRTVVNVDAESLKRIRLEALDTQDKLLVSEEAEELYDPTEAQENESEANLPTLSEGWDGLRTALTETELGAIRLVLEGGDVKAFADAHGVMLEVLADGINEKAADHIGDSLLELDGGVYIYDEYKNKAAEMVK
jgi:hypothetical protein